MSEVVAKLFALLGRVLMTCHGSLPIQPQSGWLNCLCLEVPMDKIMSSYCLNSTCAKLEVNSTTTEQFFFLPDDRTICCIFELEGIRKHLMTGPKGNSGFCFPETISVA